LTNGKLNPDYYFDRVDTILKDLRDRIRRVYNRDGMRELVQEYDLIKNGWGTGDYELGVILKERTESGGIVGTSVVFDKTFHRKKE